MAASAAGSGAWERAVRAFAALQPGRLSLAVSADDGPTIITAGNPDARARIWVEVVAAGEQPSAEAASAGAATLHLLAEGLTATRVSQFREAVLERALLNLMFPHPAVLDQPARSPHPRPWLARVPAYPAAAVSVTAAPDTGPDDDADHFASWPAWWLPTPATRAWEHAVAAFRPTLVLTLEDWTAVPAADALAGAGLRLVESFALPNDHHDRLSSLAPSLPRRNWRRRLLFGERWLAEHPRSAMGAAVQQYVRRMGYPVLGEPYAGRARRAGGAKTMFEVAEGRYIPVASVRRLGVPVRTEAALHSYGADGLAVQVFGGRPVAARVGALLAAIEGALVHALGLIAEPS